MNKAEQRVHVRGRSHSMQQQSHAGEHQRIQNRGEDASANEGCTRLTEQCLAQLKAVGDSETPASFVC